MNTSYVNALTRALMFIDMQMIKRVAEEIKSAPIILVCGNGGSSSIAQHFASDLRSTGYRAIDLVSPAKVTQVMNDISAEDVFWEQVKMFPEALVVAFSCSGTSPNIKKVFDNHERCILFTSLMRELNTCTNRLIYRVMTSDYEIAEDVFSAICHMIKKALLDELVY